MTEEASPESSVVAEETPVEGTEAPAAEAGTEEQKGA